MRRRFLHGIALVAVLGLAATACGSGSPQSTRSSQVTGGKIVLGAEQWPDCINPVTVCSQASWMLYTVEYPVLPRLMQVDLTGKFVPSPLLAGPAPTLDNGGLTQTPFTVTFHLNPKAVWDDGSPITSADVDFTWKAILNTTGTLTTQGYDQITSIDTTDPHTVKLTFKSIYVDWPDLFGGVGGFVLRKASFPTANAARPDLKNEFAESYPFSGGPWKVQSWSKQQEILVANRKYWGHQPILDQVTFVPREDQPTELQAVVNGEVAAIYPQPSDQSLLNVFAQNPSVHSVSGVTASDEALWLNLRDWPFGPSPSLSNANPAGAAQAALIRQAFAYAVDREDVVNTIIKRNNPNAAVLNCGLLWYVNVQPWCDPNDPTTLPFAKYTYNPQMSLQLLQQAGADCSGVSTASDKPCTYQGKPLNLTYSTVSTNTRRIATQELLKEKFKGTGFSFSAKNYPGTDLFGDPLQRGLFNFADFANSGSLDPSVTTLFGCDQFPSPANSFTGQNSTFWCNQQAWALMKQSDQELDVTKRAAQIHQIGMLEGQDVPALPLYPFTYITAWRADKIGGPVGQWNSGIYGTFFNMDYWYCLHACR
jgi:peptide/nickel transport system substrate-binding protein